MTEDQSISSEVENNRVTIKNARKEAKVSQAELAKRIGVHWITISRLERGIIPVKTDWTFKILRALKVDMDGTILYGMMKRGLLTTTTITPNNKVKRTKKSIVARFNTIPFSDEGHWYQIVSMEWEPIARLGDVVRFSKPSTDNWMFAHGRLCLAQSETKKFVQCGILKTKGEWFEEGDRSAYRLESLNGKILLSMPFGLIGVATTVMYNSFRVPESGPIFINPESAKEKPAP